MQRAYIETMALRSDKEAFIPYRLPDLIAMCREDGFVQAESANTFQRFCDILVAYNHQTGRRGLLRLKNAYAAFNPDRDTLPRGTLDRAQRKALEGELVERFQGMLRQANYRPMDEEDLQAAFSRSALIPLRTHVDFNDFEQVLFFYRGDHFKEATRKRFYVFNEKVRVDNLERVAMLLKFKPREYFQARKRKIKDLNFEPGKLYLYLYKDIPKYDAEILFPNVQISMNWLDRMLFAVPAVGGFVALAVRVLPSLLIVLALVLYFLMGPEALRQFDLELQERNIYPALIAALSVAFTLGGFAVKQYLSYKNKRLKFLKLVTDTLFFKNLAVNRAVLFALHDAAEEERSKEMVLVYYHLLQAAKPISRPELDRRIEEWLARGYRCHIDFDIDKAVESMKGLTAPAPGQTGGQRRDIALLQEDRKGLLHVAPLEEAMYLLDYRWDHVFDYYQPSRDG